VFRDVDSLKLGQCWSPRIVEVLGQVLFFVPILRNPWSLETSTSIRVQQDALQLERGQQDLPAAAGGLEVLGIA